MATARKSAAKPRAKAATKTASLAPQGRPQTTAPSTLWKFPGLPLLRQPHLLELALTHRSFTYEARHGRPTRASTASRSQKLHDQRNAPGTDNEQLEFLGDAILGLAVTEALFTHFPQCSEGELTRMRASLVSRKRLADVGAALGSATHLSLGRTAEATADAASPPSSPTPPKPSSPPSTLTRPAAGGLPAGARAGRAVPSSNPTCPPCAMRSQADTDGALRDHKTLLQERVQATNAGKLRYIDVGQTGPAHQRRFTVEAHLEAAGGTRLLSYRRRHHQEGSSAARRRTRPRATGDLDRPEGDA